MNASSGGLNPLTGSKSTSISKNAILSLGASTPHLTQWIIQFDSEIENNENVQIYSQPLASYLGYFWNIGNITNNQDISLYPALHKQFKINVQNTI